MDNNSFDTWNTDKKQINGKEIDDTFFINPRELWFVKMGKNIGFEEDGKKEFTRPVLVLKKVGNLFFVVALTTKGKMGSRFYHRFLSVRLIEKHIHNSDTSYAILSQAKVMDKRRFEEKIGYVEEKEFIAIKQKITALLL